jgi:hypothetical protein
MPGERLLAKAQEGAAKGIPPARVLAVVGAMLTQMHSAAALIDGTAQGRLDGKVRRQLVGAMSDALQAGVTRDELVPLTTLGLQNGRDPQSLNGAVGTLTDLFAQGYAHADADALIVAALEQGFTAGDFADLGRVMQDMATRMPKDDAMRSLRSLMASEAHPEWLHGRHLGTSNGGGPPPGAGHNGEGHGKAHQKGKAP